MIPYLSELRRLLNLKRPSSVSYSQSGEDLIVDFIFRALQLEKPTYLDVGANHPYLFSNTYRFYLQGSAGVLVEPDPSLFKALESARPKDVHLNVGVSGTREAKLPLYVMSTPTLNTFSHEEAKRYEDTGLHRIERIETIEVVPLMKIITENFQSTTLDFLSIDVEGLDLEIIESLDFKKCRPCVICAETLTFSEDRSERKVPEIADFLTKNDYFSYADTYINTIFVDRARWENRK